MLIHDFDEQLAIGIVGEYALDERFAPDYLILPATPDEQRRGIDRWYINQHTGDETAVEYKTDHVAAKTGNAFIETVSVDTAGKQGWAYTSQAEYVFYYVPALNRTYIVRLAAIRRELPRWEQQYPQGRAHNDGYVTEGVLVPLAELGACAEAIVDVEEETDGASS